VVEALLLIATLVADAAEATVVGVVVVGAQDPVAGALIGVCVSIQSVAEDDLAPHPGAQAVLLAGLHRDFGRLEIAVDVVADDHGAAAAMLVTRALWPWPPILQCVTLAAKSLVRKRHSVYNAAL
jgi:hypothetical protein